jgi:hypothetical protein
MTVTMGHGRSDTTRRPFVLGVEMAGLLILLLGAWGGIVPYVGPAFGFSGDGTASWTWNLAHSLLFLVPGAVAVVAGALIMFVGAVRPSGRALLAMAGLVAAICGAWFIVGPLAWRAMYGSNFFVGASGLRELAYWVGYALGPGGLLVALGAFVFGRARAMTAVRPA